MRGDYLAIVTLGFGLIIENVIANLPFAGGNGLAEGTASSVLYKNGLGIKTALQAQYVYFPIILTIICVAFMFMFITTSKYGRAIKSIREDEIAGKRIRHQRDVLQDPHVHASPRFSRGLRAGCIRHLHLDADDGVLYLRQPVDLEFDVHRRAGGAGRHGFAHRARSSRRSRCICSTMRLKTARWVSWMPQFLQNLFAFPMLIYALVLMAVIMFKPFGLMGTYEFSLRKLLFENANRPIGGEAK